MFREGGWAVPLQCDSPILQRWLTQLKWICSILGVPCDTYIDKDLGVCPGKWSPLTITATATIFLVLALLFLTVCFKQFLAWLSSHRGSTMAAIAAAAAAELHKANPGLYPPAPHAWIRLTGVQLITPLLCMVCHERIQLEEDIKKVQCCEVCGVVLHEGCARKASQDCRPVAEAGDRMMHLWKPVGVVMHDPEEDMSEGMVHSCMYCQLPCEADLFTSEPTWSCAWCRATTHVRCFHGFHAHAIQKAATECKQRSQKAKRDKSEKPEANQTLKLPKFKLDSHSGSRPTKRSGKKHKRTKSLHSIPTEIGVIANGIHKSDSGSKLGLGSLLRATGDLSLLRSRRRGSLGALLGSIAAAVSGSTDTAEDPVDEQPQAGPRQPGEVDLEGLDTCTFGAHRRLVLPPTAVRLIPGSSWSDRAKSFLRVAKKKSSSSDIEPDSHFEGKGGTQRVASWWGEPHIPWSSYRIERVPPGCKPLLVFMNTKSGPQLGSRLRRRLLRLLNPIQVVELPKEKPEEPLELFANVPNLQILVMGGDGTAGWILSCLDAMQEKRALLPDPQVWSPPPVAVIPLGTGNDLARCLHWGGSFHAPQRSITGLLHEIEHDAIVALLDRWNVTLDSTQQSSTQGTLSRMGSLRESDNPKVVKKAMNNYLGIGVDAKAALDFHALRNSYPSWFCSQVGNKLWYTGFGAKDILGHASRGLARKLEVECDGKVLDLPEDIEGILLLNINSYMGGVDLWASGAWQPGQQATTKQSICDGRLEVVAVYGSWHLGQLQVGLSRALRLGQCSRLRITTNQALPMQLDGEPWHQQPATIQIDLKMKAFMLRRVNSKPLSRVAGVVTEVLEEMNAKGVITPSQRHAITTEIAARLHAVLQ